MKEKENMERKKAKEEKVEKKEAELICCGDGEKPCDGKKDKEGRQARQLIWILATVGIIFIAFIGGYFYIKSLDKFSYGGVNWEKIKEGSLTLYYSRFQVSTNQYYNLYLRNDPRENKIPIINTTFKFHSNVIASLEPDAGNCREATLGQVTLGQFLTGIGVSSVRGALSDEKMAKAMNLTFANCSFATNQTTIILIKKTNETSIQPGENSNCYVINAGDCKNVESIEKFAIGVIAQSKNVKIN